MLNLLTWRGMLLCHDREARGFNVGTLGIPNLRDHGGTLRLIGRIVANHVARVERGRISWLDQPIANYVDARTGGFASEPLTRYVRYGFPGVEADPGGRRGLVHFWPPRDPAGKLAAMQAYLAALDRAFGPPPP